VSIRSFSELSSGDPAGIMPTGQAAELDYTPGVTTRAPYSVMAVEVLPGYRLKVRFRDGVEGIVDMSKKLKSDCGVFVALRDEAVFAKPYLAYGAVTWPGELDIAPDAMDEEIRQDQDRKHAHHRHRQLRAPLRNRRSLRNTPYYVAPE
jgi:hypothetical protein